MKHPALKQFALFVLVGSLGLGADYLAFLAFALWLPVELARVFSFLVAVNVTYTLNRLVTFAGGQARYGWYVFGQAKGFLLNYLVFTLCLLVLADVAGGATLAFLTGSAVALFFNFAYAKYIALR
jgi:putative flippase GtrA